MAWIRRLRGIKLGQSLREVLTLIFGTGLAQVITLGAMVVLARLYTDADFGLLSLLESIVGILAIMASLRYEQAIVLPEEDSGGQRVLATCLRLIAAFSLACALVVVFGRELIWAWRPELGNYIYLIPVLVASTALISAFTFWLTRLRAFRQISATRLENAATTAGAQILAGLALPAGPAGLVAGRVLGSLVNAAFLAKIGAKYFQSQSFTWEQGRQVMRRYRKMPLLNGVGALADAVRLNGISILLYAFFSAAILGQFALAWKIVQAPVVLISASLSQVYLRQLARTPRGQVYATTRRLVGRAALVGAGPFALLALAAPLLFTLIFGPQWQTAGQIVTILCPWLYLNLITSPISNVFIATESQQFVMPFSVVFMAVPLGLISALHSAQWEFLPLLMALSGAMTCMLIGFIGLALWTARRYDRAPQPSSTPREEE